MMPLISGILITLFGGLTIYFNDPVFVYSKTNNHKYFICPCFAILENISQKNLSLKKLWVNQLPLTDIGWELLNRRWMYYFLL